MRFGLLLLLKLLAKASQKKTVYYQVSVYPMRFPLVEMVKEPGVGVNEKFALCSRPRDLRTTGANGVLCVLRHTVMEHGQQIWVVTDKSILTPQDSH